ncbi:MAG: sulfatase-like hydrolase/transferase [Spirochaetota bacterium]
MNLKRKHKIIFLILLVFILFLSAFYIWQAFIFFPNDYKITKEEAQKTEDVPGSQVIAFSLIDLLGNAEISGYNNQKTLKILNTLKDNNYLIKDDPFIKNAQRNLCFRAGTGFPGIWIDERSSIIIPDKAAIAFYLNPDKAPMLEFSAISLLEGGSVNIEVSALNGEKITHSYNIKKYEHKYSSKDAAIKWSNIGYKKAREDTGWQEFRIDLKKFSGLSTKILFSFKSDKDDKGVVFLANPRIFKISEKRRYNVIYLVFDGVSTRHWSFYNERSNLTPYMKKIAEKEFVVFDNMFSLGNKTRISTAGLFSSVLPYNTRHGINRNYIPENEKENYYKLVRSGALASMPDVFRKNGYIAEQFGNSGFTVHLLSTGVDYGFEKSYEFSYNPYDSYGISHNLFKFLRKNKSREFFLYLHYNTPHKPFYAPINYFFTGFINAPFECLWRPDFMGCISYTDDVFKNIYLALRSNNLLENTILIVATDHGAGYDIKKFDSGFMYNDYTRMTFMMRLPEKLKKNYNINEKRIATYISSINTAPTLVDLCGLNKVQAFKGRSYLDVLNKTYSKQFFDNEIWCFDRKAVSVITDDMYKYILTFPDGNRMVKWENGFWGEQKEIPYEEIYDLKSDSEETRNLIHKNKPILKKFRNIYFSNDIHHPERTVLYFLNNNKDKSNIEVDIFSQSKLTDVSLYTEKLQKLDTLKILMSGATTRLAFELDANPLYLTFENENDRSPLSVLIKSDGRLLDKSQIYATYLNLNIFGNPVNLADKKDFFLLNETRLASKTDLIIKKNLSVKISRIDLHRWIDIGNLETSGISAGMKETLKSWGYIQ